MILRKTNSAIQWVRIFPVDSVNNLSKRNWCLVDSVINLRKRNWALMDSVIDLLSNWSPIQYKWCKLQN